MPDIYTRFVNACGRIAEIIAVLVTILILSFLAYLYCWTLLLDLKDDPLVNPPSAIECQKRSKEISIQAHNL